MALLGRRSLLAGAVSLLALGPAAARAAIIEGGLPWRPDSAEPPTPALPGPWLYFTAEEGAAVEAIVDRLIPPEPGTPGGKDAGCAVFIDRQLAGPYGRSAGLYMRPPFREGTTSQGNQSPLTPAMRYREALAALDAHCRKAFAGQPFAAIPQAAQDRVLHGLEDNTLPLEGSNGHAFFEQVLKDTQQGFFADPVYGGNRDMCAWRMIGFPGARYDYRDWIDRHNEPFPLPPVAIGGGRPDWTHA